jgi:Tat protein translocase TatB subunit
MFGLGIWEIVVILVVALLFLGPEKLPKFAGQLGRGLREFRRAASEFQANLAHEAERLDDKDRDENPSKDQNPDADKAP